MVDKGKEAQKIAQTTGPVPGWYRHFKHGDLYEVLMCSVDEKTLTPEVVYRAQATGYVWHRPITEWSEPVMAPDGTTVPRYAPMREPAP